MKKDFPTIIALVLTFRMSEMDGRRTPSPNPKPPNLEDDSSTASPRDKRQRTESTGSTGSQGSGAAFPINVAG